VSGPFERHLGEAALGLGLLHLGDERGLDRLGAGAVAAQPIGFSRQLLEPNSERLAVRGDPAKLALAALDGVAE
jgi:hypothetical protein